MHDEPIHISVPASSDDPRLEFEPPPGVIVHRVPEMHPDDVTTLYGIPVSTLERTVIDVAEDLDREALRGVVEKAFKRGFDWVAYDASRARVEWRPSLAMLDEVIAEFR